jgi:MFS transporter, DHA2 family, multidrug resistance protein
MLSATSSGTVGKMPLSDQLDAVAIYMTVRQLGASLGVTMVTIVLNWRETLHSSRLYEHLQAGATQTRGWMSTAAQSIMQRGGYSPFEARHMALGLLSRLGTRQAATLAYSDAFLFMAGIGLVALFFVPLMSPTSVVKK